MSETFLIKKTAYDSLTGTLAERDANSFIVGPGELNGVGGQSRSSELRLYGLGSLKWGEGVNENLFRLIENYACPQKLPTDPGYINASTPTPRDEGDLGIGNGINVPNFGQSWYNISDGEMYTYALSSTWRLITASASGSGAAALAVHTSNDAQHLVPTQNTYLDALNLPTLTAADTNQLVNITGNVQVQLNTLTGDKVNRVGGDTMTGTLTLDNLAIVGTNANTYGISMTTQDFGILDGHVRIVNGMLTLGAENNNIGWHRITTSSGIESTGDDFNVRIGNQYNPAVAPTPVHTQANSGAITLTGSTKYGGVGIREKPQFDILVGNSNNVAVNSSVNYTGYFEFLSDGNLRINGNQGIDNPNADEDFLTTKKYVRDNYLPLTGGAMRNANSDISMSGANITFLDTPLNSPTHYAANIAFVNSTVAPKANTASPTLTGTPRAPLPGSGAPLDQIATVGLVQSSGVSGVIIGRMINILINTPKPYYGGSYYVFHRYTAGLNSNGVWYNLYQVISDLDGYGQPVSWTRAAAPSPLMHVVNDTPYALLTTGSIQLQHNTDDLNTVRIIVSQTGEILSGPFSEHSHANQIPYTTLTYSYVIPANTTRTIHVQGKMTDGWNADNIRFFQTYYNTLEWI